MALPAAVQKQIDEANAIAAKIYPPPVDNAAEDTSASEPVAETPPAPVSTLPTVDFEQKYKVLQGKYNAEVPRLQGQLRELSNTQQNLQSQLTGTQTLLASLSQGAPRAPTTPDGVPPSSVRSLIKDEEIKEFGPDLVDLMRRVATETVMPQVEGRLRPLSQELDRTSKAASSAVSNAMKTEEEKVHAQLTNAVPNWLTLNEDENFHAWLDLTDPYSGEKRGDLLTRAYNRHDGPRVVTFFQGFLNENATVAPPAPTTPTTRTPSVALESMVAPGTARAGSTAGAQDGANKRIWTAADISQFYKDKSGGKYARNQKQAVALEADIFAAQAEGRIRQR